MSEVNRTEQSHSPSESELAILQRQTRSFSQKSSYFSLYQFVSVGDVLCIAVATLCAVTAGVVTSLTIVVFGQLIGLFQDVTLATIGNAEFETKLREFVLYFVYLAVAVFVLAYISNVIFIRNGQRQSNKIRKFYLEATLRQNIGFFDMHGAGEMTSRITGDMELVRDGLGEKVGFTVKGLTTFVGAYVVGFVKSWKLTLILSTGTVAILLLLISSVPFLTRYKKRNVEASAAGGTIAQEAINFIRSVNALGIQEKMASKYEANSQEAANWGTRERFVFGMLGAGAILVIYLTYGLCYWQGTRFVRNDELDIATLVTVLEVLVLGGFALSSVLPFFKAFTSAAVAGARILATIGRESPLDFGIEDGGRLDHIKGEICFADVKLIYPSRPERVVIEQLNLCIPSGKTTAIVGPSGSGKSSIFEMIERFYEPVRGQISIDGHDIRSLNLHWLRQHISLVTQEPVLFRTTIFNNIAFGLKNKAFEKSTIGKIGALVEEVAKTCLVDPFVQEFPDKYQTVVGERGVFLSGGQKQRIALARAVISNPSILLLDEATSALDSKSEKQVQAAISAVSKNRTTVVIAHRLSTIREADKILVVRNGTILEQGTHNELLERHGPYYQLVQAQDFSRQEDKYIFSGSADHDEVTTTRRPHDSMVAKEPAILEGKENSTNRDNKHIEDASVTSKRVDKSFPKCSTWSLFKWLVQLNNNETPLMIVGLIGSVVSGLGMTTSFFFVAKATDALAFLGSDAGSTTLSVDFWAAMFLMLAMIEFLAFATFGLAFAVCAERLNKQAKVRTFRSILRQGIPYFDKDENSVGALVSHLANETTKLVGLSGVTLGTILEACTALTSSLVAAVAVGWKLGLVCAATIPLLLASGYYRFHCLATHEKQSRDVYRASGALACEAVATIRTVASLAREKGIIQSYSSSLKGHERKFFSSTLYSSLFFSLSEAIGILCSALALWYGGTLLRDGEYSLFRVIFCFEAIFFGADAVATIFSFAGDMGRAREAARILKKIMELSPWNGPEGFLMTNEANSSGNLNFQDVYFHYPTRKDRHVLKGVNFEVKSKGSIALVGESGSGKSTIVHLLEKFYRPCKGTILLDGLDINLLSTTQYRSRISLVSQQSELYEGTVRENIMIGLDDEEDKTIAENAMENACKDANIHDFIISLPNGFDTKLGTEGKLLSGGQKQRITIARALIRRPQILLMDEATSALDAESAGPVQEALNNAADGRMSIIIAHQLKTVQHCDLICVVHDGRIVESGTHAELMAKRARYYELATVQSLGRT